MKTLLHSDTESLVNALESLRGNTFVTLVTVVTPSQRKNPFGKIYKMSKTNVDIGFIYKNSVNNQIGREGGEATFVPARRVWGRRIPGTPLVEHKGNLYLETMPLKSLSHKYFRVSGDGIELLTKAEVAPYLTKSAEGTRQPNEKKVILRDYKIENVSKITSGGITYKIG